MQLEMHILDDGELLEVLNIALILCTLRGQGELENLNNTWTSAIEEHTGGYGYQYKGAARWLSFGLKQPY